MGRNDIGKAPTYNSKLYATCQYMIHNSGQFKDYAIFNNRMALDGDNKYLDLHNCLINIFNFLSGKSKKKSKSGNAKGSDIMASLNLEEVPEEKLAMILTVFYEYTFENHKSTGQLFDIDIEKSFPLLNALIKNLNQNHIDDMEKMADALKMQDEQESIEENDYAQILNAVYENYKRKLISYLSQFVNTPLYSHYSITPKITFYHKALIENKEPVSKEFSDFMGLLEKENPQFGDLRNAYYAWLYCDLCCHSVLQQITSLFKTIRFNFPAKKLEKPNSTVLELIHEYSQQGIEAKGSPEEILFYFTSYYHIRDKFLQDTNILKYITENCGKRENPKPEYAFPLPQDPEPEYSMDEIKARFTEGAQVRNETFRKNYEACKNGIDEYNKKTHRQIRKYLICQKAMYREIFVDPTLYYKNRHSSKHIFLHFLKHGKLGSSDYYFLNEKINMGLYREYGWIDKFYAKNEFQENLYHLVSLILSMLYPDKIASASTKAFSKISHELEMLLCELPVDPNILKALKIRN